MIERINWKCVMVCGVFLFALYSVAAQARWKPEYGSASPEIQSWFKNQHNSEGQWCCTDADGHLFDGSYVINVDGSVTAYENGKRFDIEKSKVLTGPNPTGSAVWWFVDTAGGRTTYCFSLGSLT